MDTDGSYTCICSLGYTGNGFINCRMYSFVSLYIMLEEHSFSGTAVCSEDCDINAICAYIDVDNETKCVCRSGYMGNGYSCTSKILKIVQKCFIYYSFHFVECRDHQQRVFQ